MPAPANIYENDVDFTSLALQYPEFAKRLKPNRQLDFSDPESVRQLTKCLLHRDFNLIVNFPEDRLCPPVPNRFNYILFIQRLLDCTSPDLHDGYDPQREVIGLDIGTGCSAIYPLLACRQRPQSRFLYTELDDKNRTCAQQNITSNSLKSRIRPIDTDPTGTTLIPLQHLKPFSRIDILMTNPPFYASETSLTESAKQKSRPPNSSCTGAPIEMITPGGEVTFVGKLVLESSHRILRRKIQWFSAMLGKMSSVGTIVEKLKELGCTNYAVTEFVQGQKTRRWCVTWSWIGFRPSTGVARGVGAGSGVERKFLPALTEMDFDVEAVAVEDLSQAITLEVKRLDSVLWRWDEGKGVGMFMSREGDVWSRKARRKMKAEQEGHPPSTTKSHSQRHRPGQQEDTEMKDHNSNDNSDSDKEDSEDEQSEPAIVVRITIKPSASPQANSSAENISKKSTVHVRHLQGHDSVLFESFAGWLKRKVTSDGT